MPLTDDHPPGYMMSPKVFRQHAVGHMQNIRPGASEGMPDCLLADLFVSDQDMIAKVLAGKVQVSAGYDAQYRKISPGVYEQYKIVGNHNAFVAPAALWGIVQRKPSAVVQARRHAHAH
jgi:hypothetical protein